MTADAGRGSVPLRSPTQALYRDDEDSSLTSLTLLRAGAALGMTAAGRPTASSLISPGVQDAPRPRKGPSLPVQSAVTTPSIFFQPGVRTRAALERRSS